MLGSFKHDIPEQVFYFLDLAVPMFFVVSGYLITASAINNDLKSYFLKRFARIYPGYLVSMILVLVFFAPIAYSIVFNGFNLNNYLSLDPSPVTFILNALYFNIWLPIGNILNNFTFQTWNDSTWTLLHEVFCYIIIGVVIFLLKKMKIQNYTKIIIGLYLISFVLSVIYPRPTYHLVSFLDYVGCTLNLLTIFLGGSVAYLIRDKFEFNLKYVLLSAIFCIIVMSFVPYIFAIEICALPMTYIILYISINLKSPKFIQRNDISYGIYIYAWPIQTVLNVYITVFHITLNVFEFMILSILISIIFGLLSWFIIERPILNKTKEFLKSKQS